MIANLMELLREILMENEIGPDKLFKTLGKFVRTLELYKENKDIKNEHEAQILNDVLIATEDFIVVMELCSLFWNRLKNNATEKRTDA